MKYRPIAKLSDRAFILHENEAYCAKTNHSTIDQLRNLVDRAFILHENEAYCVKTNHSTIFFMCRKVNLSI